jgi:hypothetical protein
VGEEWTDGGEAVGPLLSLSLVSTQQLVLPVGGGRQQARSRGRWCGSYMKPANGDSTAAGCWW